MRKKRLLFQSDFALAKTGFGRNAKALLSYLYATDKYDILHYCCGIGKSDANHQILPWKSVGALPDSKQEWDQIQRDPHLARMTSYGATNLDSVIQEFKPDVYIAAQDIWGIDFAVDRKWFKKITSVLWTTLDSLPILPSAVAAAGKTDHYWIWSNFATKELHRLGHKHVDTMHGMIDAKFFRRLSNAERAALRQKFKMPQQAFVVGFVFRNQLRKSVPNLLEGYKLWRDRNPQVKHPFLLLHTHFSEGWNIHRLADEYKVNKREIITTYVCRSCHEYVISPFIGENAACPHCGAKGDKALVTTNVGVGVNETQLNEIYNLMDVYCHPFTSGGQEIPIQEAKLAELVTLVTEYSCGDEMCEDDAASLPLDWSEYREPQTEFRKASTKPSSISKQIQRVYNMKPAQREKMGKKARQWVLDNFSIEAVSQKIEAFIDKAPLRDDYDFDLKEEPRDPHALITSHESHVEWLLEMYRKILKMDVDEKNEGMQYWLGEIAKGMQRPQIEQYFRKTAVQENQEKVKIDFESMLDKDDDGKRMLVVMPQSIGDIFLVTSLFPSLKRLYPDYNLYFATQPAFFEIIQGNPYVHKLLPFVPQMENLLWLEGAGGHKGFFEIAFLPYIGTQKVFDYQHNGKDKIDFRIVPR